MSPKATFLLINALWWCVLPTSAGAQPKFEAASVKISTQRMSVTEGGPGTKSPNRIRYEGVSLRQLLMSALDIHAAQLVGPTWSEHYSVNAVLPPNSTKLDLQGMLLELVKERFHVVLREQSKELRVHELVVAEQGQKLRQSGVPAEDSGQGNAFYSPGSLKLDGRGCPVLPAGQEVAVGDSASTCTSYRQMTMEQFVPKLEMMLGAETGAIFGPTASGDPVIDKTGLSGPFDFELAYDFGTRIAVGMRGRGGVETSREIAGDDLGKALNKQLGLKLLKTTARLPVFVVEKAERIPTPN